MEHINCMLMYKCRNCNKTIEEPRSRIFPPGMPGTIRIDEYFEYKVIIHECDDDICGFCDIVGYRRKK